MAQLDLRIADVCERGTISRSIVNKARSGGSMNPLNAKRLAMALNMPLEELVESEA
ncbi:hypothetical protein [Faecalibacterium prausnitzii]|nr:hypothetical protein [Faecalibacterium prausnitzii]